ncbi:Protein-disulfide reductase [Bertholletia excelsa]
MAEGKAVEAKIDSFVLNDGEHGTTSSAETLEREEQATNGMTLTSILAPPNFRDFVTTNEGRKVRVSELEGHTVGLYFFSPTVHCLKFNETLLKVYKELKEEGKSFEIVMVFFNDFDEDDDSEDDNDEEDEEDDDDADAHYYSDDEDEDLDNEKEEFQESISNMPWLALPWKDKRCRMLAQKFGVKSLPTLFVIRSSGELETPPFNAVEAIEKYGSKAYPFTRARLAEMEGGASEAQTLSSILISGDRDFLIAKDGAKLPISKLEGKILGLYFFSPLFDPELEFNQKLVEVYTRVKEMKVDFEIVMVYLYDVEEDDESFRRSFDSMPWLALPFKDDRCMELFYQFTFESLPALVIIGPDGNIIHPNAAEAVNRHGVQVCPFTPEKFAELEAMEKAQNEAQTLESFLVSENEDFVIGKDGAKVPVSDLVGKNILLYFSAQWCPGCRGFLPKLIEAYREIKAKDSLFEVIFVSYDRDQKSFDEFYSTMPWLALPFSDKRIKSMTQKFKVRAIPKVVAIGPSGKTITEEAADLIDTHGANAYSFIVQPVNKEDEIEEVVNKKKEPEKLVEQDEEKKLGTAKKDEEEIEMMRYRNVEGEGTILNKLLQMLQFLSWTIVGYLKKLKFLF